MPNERYLLVDSFGGNILGIGMIVGGGRPKLTLPFVLRSDGGAGQAGATAANKLLPTPPVTPRLAATLGRGAR